MKMCNSFLPRPIFLPTMEKFLVSVDEALIGKHEFLSTNYRFMKIKLAENFFRKVQSNLMVS